MSNYTTNINNYQKNKFKVILTNWPNGTDLKTLNMSVFNNYIRSFAIPDLSINIMTTTNVLQTQIHPVATGNKDFQLITIEFAIDEYMQNWYAAYMLLICTKFNISLGKTNAKNEEVLRENVIDCIELQSLDTEKRVISRIKI